MSRLTATLLASTLMAACGGGNSAPAESPAVAASSDAEPVAASSESGKQSEPAADDGEAKAGVPTECASQKNDVCLPPESFVKRLCMDTFPNIALVMFRKGTPWTRGYLTRKTNAWNASGGASDNSQLEFDEEVLVLRHRAADMGGMQVSGASGGYDALRWNGSCVTLAKEELTLKPPPAAKTAHIEWRWLEDPIQEALRGDEKVDAAYKARRNECKGAVSGTVSLKCVKADSKLSETIADYVRNGGELAAPQKLP